MMKHLLIFASILIPNIAMSQDAALYEAPPPADAAFIRFVGFDDKTIDWKGLNFNLSDNVDNHYFIVHAPQVGAGVGDFVNVLPNDIAIVEPKKNAAKVTLGMINLADIPVSLKTKDGSVDIISKVESGSAGWREVNPISVAAQVYYNNEPAKENEILFDLLRGEHQTILVLPDNKIKIIKSDFISSVVE